MPNPMPMGSASKVMARMRPAPRALVAGGLGFAVSLIVADCGGSSGLLSSAQANGLTGLIQQARSDLGRNDCGGATSTLAQVAAQIQNLPSSVDSTLRSNLNQAASTVQTLVRNQCGSQNTTTTATTKTTTTATSTTTTPTTPTQTQTTPPTQTATTTTPTGTTPTGPGSGGAGFGGDNGQGNGGVPGNGTGKSNGH